MLLPEIRDLVQVDSDWSAAIRHHRLGFSLLADIFPHPYYSSLPLHSSLSSFSLGEVMFKVSDARATFSTNPETELHAQEPAIEPFCSPSHRHRRARQSALVLILRAGMALDINALKRLRFVVAWPMSLGGERWMRNLLWRIRPT